MRNGLLFVFFTLCAASASADCGYEGDVFATGLATDPRSGRLVYCEYHLPAQGSQRSVLYYSPEGYRIAEKRLSGVDSTVPAVVQQDYRHGEERIVQPRGGQVSLRYREDANSQWETAILSAGEVDVADAGFDTVVRNNWRRLASGQAVTFDFASPVHGRAIGLRARQVNCSGTADKLCLRVDLNQPILRMFAGELYLEYDRDSRRLELFDGVTNVLDSRGNSQRLRIGYEY